MKWFSLLLALALGYVCVHCASAAFQHNEYAIVYGLLSALSFTVSAFLWFSTFILFAGRFVDDDNIPVEIDTKEGLKRLVVGGKR